MSGAVSVSERTGHVICLRGGIVFFDGDVLVSATGAMRANLVMRRGRNETLVSVYGMCGL